MSSRPKLIEQRIDTAASAPALPMDFPDIIELCDRDCDGGHVFPDRDRFFSTAKTGQMVMQDEPRVTLDDYLDRFLANQGHADQKLQLMASTVRAGLSRRGAFAEAEIMSGPGSKPVVEIIVPRKAVFDGNMAAITLGEHMADKLSQITPDIDWHVAYDVVYQAPAKDPNAPPPAPRRHPKYGNQSLYMATETFADPGRSKYLIGVDDTSRFGRAFRDLHLFAAQNGKELLAVSAFQAYEADNLRPRAQTVSEMRRSFGPDGLAKLDKGLAAFGLNCNALTETEMRFFTQDPMLDAKPGQSRADAALAYLEDEASRHRLPVLLPHNDVFIQKIANREPVRFSERPRIAGAQPAAVTNQRDTGPSAPSGPASGPGMAPVPA